jgi:hypothetical protein
MPNHLFFKRKTNDQIYKSVFGIFSPNLKRPIYGYFSPFFSHVAPAMRLKKGKNHPKMISFLLSAENPEHALNDSTN